MPLLKAQKKELAKKYLSSVESARNVVVLSVEGVPVNEINKVRMDLSDAQGQLELVKKRVFLKGIEGKYEGLTLDQVGGSVALLYSHNEEDMHAPLKVISKHTKLWKKGKHEFGFDYVGGWYESVWQDKAYVTELADLPSKEELVGKFIYMLNHPVSSFARVLKAIADKEDAGVEAPVAQEAPAEEAQESEAKVDEAANEESASEESAPAGEDAA